MPLVDLDRVEVWDSLYRCVIDGQIVHYSRSAKQQYYGNDVDTLVKALVTKGLTKGQRIALIGCGFGWMAERFIELGYGPIADGTDAGRIVHTDISTWIHSNKVDNAVLPILNSDVNLVSGRDEIKAAFDNHPIDWCISEDILPCLHDDECTTLAFSMRQISSNVVHWVSTPCPVLNNKMLPQWKELITPDLVIHRGTDEVL
jgi:hypothetical protein